MNEILNELFGANRDPDEFTVLHVVLRSVIIFVSGLVMVRVGAKRFFARKTAFDVVLALILASTLARAINGSGALLPTIAGGFVLVLMHRLIAAIAYYFEGFGGFVKGHKDLVVEDGRLNVGAMRKNLMTEEDLLEDLRANGHRHWEEIDTGYIERNGDLTVIAKRATRGAS